MISNLPETVQLLALPLTSKSVRSKHQLRSYNAKVGFNARVGATAKIGVTALSACLLLIGGMTLTSCSTSPGSVARAQSTGESSAGGSQSGGTSAGSAGYSGSDSASGIPGSSAGSSSGSDAVNGSDPDTPVSSDGSGTSSSGSSGSNANSSDTVVSSGPLGNQHEWTQEEMLLARPMPMSQEERDFVFKHKAPDSIRTWTLGEFQEYTNTPMGRTQLLQEGRRWVSIKNSLKDQLALGQDFLAGGGRKPKKSKPNANGANGDGQSVEQIPDFLIDEGVFQGAESATTFDHLKECRQDITDLCRSIEGVKKVATKRGRLEALEKYMSAE